MVNLMTGHSTVVGKEECDHSLSVLPLKHKVPLIRTTDYKASTPSDMLFSV